MLDLLAGKLHEFCWAEKLVGVAAPTAAATVFQLHSAAAASAAAQQGGPGAGAQAGQQPVAAQIAVVEFSLSLLAQLLTTARKAHIASRRLTNRVQLVSEGRQGSSDSVAPSESPLDSYAPFSFRPIFLHALSTLPESSIGAKLSPAAMENLAQIALLSAPAPAAPVTIPASAQQKLVFAVADTDADVTHFFFSLHSLADAVLAQQQRPSASSTDSLHSFLAWTDLLLQGHPRVAGKWFAAEQPHAALSRTLVSFYRLLSSSSTAGAADEQRTQRSLTHLNSVLARVLGLRAGADKTPTGLANTLQGQLFFRTALLSSLLLLSLRPSDVHFSCNLRPSLALLRLAGCI